MHLATTPAIRGPSSARRRQRRAVPRAWRAVALCAAGIVAGAPTRTAGAQTAPRSDIAPHEPLAAQPSWSASPDGRAPGDGALDSLVARALSANPQLRAARSRVAAAGARVAPAGTLPDPTLMAGVQNLPPGSERVTTTSPHGGSTTTRTRDPMTMHMIGVEQTLPYPGKLSLRRRVADREVDASRAQLEAVAREVARDVKDAYYELALLDQSLEIVRRNAGVLGTFIRVTEARYGVGTTGQQDVLRARVEATRLAETAASLTERRRSALARLNALLNRPSETPVGRAAVPATLVRAAVGDSGREVHFTSAALGARAADSPLPPLAELQDAAIRGSPELREHEAMIAAQAARLEGARKEALPDVDVSLQYGQRTGFTDMVTATVSVPLPVFKHRKQDQLVADASATLDALHAEHVAKQNQIRADVARLASEVERARTQLALYTKAILPQARGALVSATLSYQVGRTELLAVLDSQATVFSYETEYYRALTDFAKNVAELERLVGKGVVR